MITVTRLARPTTIQKPSGTPTRQKWNAGQNATEKNAERPETVIFFIGGAGLSGTFAGPLLKTHKTHE